MKRCPNCKAELEDKARFCLSCMTSLDEKEQIPPPVKKFRRWDLVLLCFLCMGIALFVILGKGHVSAPVPEITTEATEAPETENAKPPVTESMAPETENAIPENAITQSIDGVTYTFRPATEDDHPSALRLENCYVLIRVEGDARDGVYQVPSFVGEDLTALVTVVADGAFNGTGAKVIDLGYNVRYVWGNGFGGNALTDLYLHEDVRIDRESFSGCSESLTIHCPEYLENTEGLLWADLAIQYGFQWQPEAI